MSLKLLKTDYLTVLIDYMKDKKITTKLAVNVSRIKRDTGISYNTIKKYVEYIFNNNLVDWKEITSWKELKKDESTH